MKMLSEKVIKEFASSILISDVQDYIKNHKEEYNKWLNNSKESEDK